MVDNKENERSLPNEIAQALDRALSVLGQTGKDGIFEDLSLTDIEWDSDNEGSVISAIEEYLEARFQKGSGYLISRFRDELEKRE